MSDDGGFTLVELVVAMAIGIGVLFTAGRVLQTTTQQSTDIAARVDANARARVAMNSMISDLQGQVCVSPTRPPVVAVDDAGAVATDGRMITFTTDLTGTGGPPSKVRLAYNPSARTVTRTVWAGTGLPPTTQWQGPASVSTVLTGAVVPSDGRMLHYFAYNPLAPAVALTELDASTNPASPLSATDAKSVVRVALSIGASPAEGSKKRDFLYSDDAWVGTAEGDNAALGPQC